ncbi:ergothioneine biosynthesis protein EgtC [Nocardia sp. NPDC127579]|uniref:ergothioneine biosynthesis protein EgtC n=1 Tax=Nocardia sp. NPDC127579 TaxID=3345402 RepID=UPI003635CE21
MCRHLGYVGPEVAVGELVTRGPHSLYRQSWAPLEMRGGGTINADGFGVAWWRSEQPGPIPLVSRYRNPDPIWTDPAVEEVLGQLRAGAALASIRSASPGMPVQRAACAPFTSGRWAFSHNGRVPEWRRVVTAVSSDLDTAATQWGATRLFETARLLEAEAATDAATLWVLLTDLLTATGPGQFAESPGAALALLTTTVLTHAPDARLNFLLGDGEQLWATTVHHSLSALVTDEVAILSSEPYDDDPRWQPIPDRRLVAARPGQLTVEPLTAP